METHPPGTSLSDMQPGTAGRYELAHRAARQFHGGPFHRRDWQAAEV